MLLRHCLLLNVYPSVMGNFMAAAAIALVAAFTGTPPSPKQRVLPSPLSLAYPPCCLGASPMSFTRFRAWWWLTIVAAAVTGWIIPYTIAFLPMRDG